MQRNKFFFECLEQIALHMKLVCMETLLNSAYMYCEFIKLITRGLCYLLQCTPCTNCRFERGSHGKMHLSRQFVIGVPNLAVYYLLHTCIIYTY